jgi:adenosylcobalamin-dependent ribonucleoside-triphosphate reductase
MNKFHPETPFAFLMEASMLGVGVGFDTDGADKEFTIYTPTGIEDIQIEDSREGWVESMSSLLRSYLVPNHPHPQFDYSLIRLAGEPIRGFGGTAAGPGPLIDLHEALDKMFAGREDQFLTSRDIVDIANKIGKCVVAGNVRRSAELALGKATDEEFLNLKNYDINPDRADYGWVSNNSIRVTVGGQDYEKFVPLVVENGEPGFIYMDVTRAYGRLVDAPNNKDYRAMGYNPCAEQPLESYEMCTLVEAFPTRCEDQADFDRTLKFAYLYAKAVTLLPTHWPETNAVMQRNRRIGCSVSGLAQFVETHNWTELRSWLNDGYGEVQKWDQIYSDWLGVRESIKTTTVKPSGSVSLLAGTTPGAHWPTNDTYIRRMRLASKDPLTQALEESGYNVEPAFGNEETTVVVELPVQGLGIRTEKEVTIFEKIQLAVLAQRYWSDNGVSLTVTFDPDQEAQYIATVLRMYEGQLKALSFLPIKDNAYQQMPYEAIEDDTYESMGENLTKLKWGQLYRNGTEAIGEKYCTTDACEIPIQP